MTALLDTTSTISSIVGLGLTIGALGLAMNFVGEASRGFQPAPKGKRRQDNIFDFDMGYTSKKGGKRSNDIFNWAF